MMMTMATRMTMIDMFTIADAIVFAERAKNTPRYPCEWCFYCIYPRRPGMLLFPLNAR